jgi:hypothetical protein
MKTMLGGEAGAAKLAAAAMAAHDQNPSEASEA